MDRLDEKEQQEYLNAMASEYDILVHTEGAVQETKREIAKSMLSDGIPDQKIAQWTGLSEEEIERLK